MAEKVTSRVLSTCQTKRCFVNSVKHYNTFCAHRGDQISKHADEVYQVFWDSNNVHLL